VLLEAGEMEVATSSGMGDETNAEDVIADGIVRIAGAGWEGAVVKCVRGVINP
jgi:hypothetical protein